MCTSALGIAKILTRETLLQQIWSKEDPLLVTPGSNRGVPHDSGAEGSCLTKGVDGVSRRNLMILFIHPPDGQKNHVYQMKIIVEMEKMMDVKTTRLRWWHGMEPKKKRRPPCRRKAEPPKQSSGKPPWKRRGYPVRICESKKEVP